MSVSFSENLEILILGHLDPWKIIRVNFKSWCCCSKNQKIPHVLKLENTNFGSHFWALLDRKSSFFFFFFWRIQLPYLFKFDDTLISSKELGKFYKRRIPQKWTNSPRVQLKNEKTEKYKDKQNENPNLLWIFLIYYQYQSFSNMSSIFS